MDRDLEVDVAAGHYISKPFTDGNEWEKSEAIIDLLDKMGVTDPRAGLCVNSCTGEEECRPVVLFSHGGDRRVVKLDIVSHDEGFSLYWAYVPKAGKGIFSSRPLDGIGCKCLLGPV